MPTARVLSAESFSLCATSLNSGTEDQVSNTCFRTQSNPRTPPYFAGLIPRETLTLGATSEVLAAFMGGAAHITSAPEVAAEEQRSFEKNDLTLTLFVSLDTMGTLESQPRYRIWESKKRNKSLLEDLLLSELSA